MYSLKTAGHSQVEIAKNLGRNPSTISRGLRRNTGQGGYYLHSCCSLNWEKSWSVSRGRS
ncbi:helix-turn-helix domain-containing protein [Microbulbifer thermotolerans]|uniref:helix-turn-helix domain-containing protein n=1 Tax=Microbulbifer thermotolerans TaxID=252514 RepID=UPI00396A8143